MAATHRVRYCRPLHSQPFADALAAATEADDGFDLYEFWIDTLSNFQIDDLESWTQTHPERGIVVWERGPSDLPRSTIDPTAVLDALLPLPLYVDLDLDRQSSLARRVADEPKRTLRLITSHHDYNATPERSELDRRVDRLLEFEPDVVKIATRCHSPDDALALLELGRRLHAENRPHVILGMGAHGLVTRIFGTLWSNRWVYAPRTAAEATAPGQSTRDQLARWIAPLDATQVEGDHDRG